MKKLHFMRCGAILVVLSLMWMPLRVTAQQTELEQEIIEALQKSDIDALDIWIAKGGDINLPTKSKNTLLMMAAKIGDKPIVDYLMSKLPDVDVQNEAGATALMLASKYGHEHVVDILLEGGANPTVTNNNGHTASRFALAYKHYKIYEKLQRAEEEFDQQS